MKMERGQGPDHPRFFFFFFHPRFLKVRSFLSLYQEQWGTIKVFGCVYVTYDVCMCVCVHVQACVTDEISILKRPQARPEVSKRFL